MPINIGLTMNYHFSADNIERAYLDHTYFDSLAKRDILCRPIFPIDDDRKMEQYLDTVSGLIFTGGLDLDLETWEVPLHPKAVLVHRRRQDFELRLLKAALARKMPILGICLGMQLINIALGGEICQHIPELCGVTDHGYDGNKTCHTVNINSQSKLFQWFNCDSIEVPSVHHQGITKAGSGLLTSAIAEDGIIEAVEMPEYPFLMAVQWHPEKESDSELSDKIFSAFIESCTSYLA